nr:ORF7 [Acipenserid herpesvirus 1]
MASNFGIVRSLAKALAMQCSGCFGILDRCPIAPLTDAQTKNVLTLCQQVYGNYAISAYLKKIFPPTIKTPLIIGCMRVLLRQKAFTEEMQINCIQFLFIWLLVNKYSGDCSQSTFQYLLSVFIALLNCPNPLDTLNVCFNFTDPQCKADFEILFNLNFDFKAATMRVSFLLCEYAFNLATCHDKPAHLGYNHIKCCVYAIQTHLGPGNFNQLRLCYLTPDTPAECLTPCPCIVLACQKQLNICLLVKND